MAAAKKQPTLVTVNRNWQLAFIAAMVVTQLISTGTVLWMFTRHGNYIGSGTWAFQVSQWVYPLLFVAAAYPFVRKRIVGIVPKIFWMIFVATIGLVAWSAVMLLLNGMFALNNWWPQITSADKSWWSAFGITWTEMLVFWVLYCLGLWLIASEGERRR
jgi:hypothetical protein